MHHDKAANMFRFSEHERSFIDLNYDWPATDPLGLLNKAAERSQQLCDRQTEIATLPFIADKGFHLRQLELAKEAGAKLIAQLEDIVFGAE